MLLQAPEDRLRLRLRVWRQRAQLDAALANGADPDEDRTIALRAGQLTAPSTREAIARTVHKLLDAAEEPREPWSHNGAQPPLQHEAVLAARDDLVAIANSLSTPHDISPQAAALASMLVWDSTSPVYTSDPEATVAQWAATLLAELDAS